MEFKDAMATIEKNLTAKILSKCPSNQAEDQQQFTWSLYNEAFEKFRSAPGVELDLPEMVMFLGKMCAMGGVGFLKPGHTPEEIRTALNETAQVFTGSFVDLALVMYGEREKALIAEKNQSAQGQGPQKQKPQDAGRVIDLSKLGK